MKNIVDQLALAYSPISTTNLILQVLDGLDSDYNGVVSVVVNMVDRLNLTWSEVQSTLLSFESRLEKLNHFSSLTLQPSVNFVQGNRPDGGVPTRFPNTMNQSSGRGGWRGAPSSRGFSGCRSHCRRLGNSIGSRPYSHIYASVLATWLPNVIIDSI